MASTDARPIPKKNTAYRLYAPIWDADGDLVSGAASLDSEVSIDGGTFADCTNEATEIATASGVYYLDLTAAEMNGDAICVIIKTGTAGAKTTPIVLYPEEAGDVRVNVTAWNGTAVPAEHTAGYPIVTVKDGTGTGEIDTASGVVLAKDHTGANLATAAALTIVDDFLDTEVADIQARLPAALVSGRIDASVGAMAAGVVTAAAVATNAIDADAIAADAVTEIQAGLSTLSAAQVNAEVVDALAVDTYAEPGQGAPAATATLAAKINYLFKAFRNKKTQTSSTYSLFADDATTVDQKATVSDDGTTTTIGEVVTGP